MSSHMSPEKQIALFYGQLKDKTEELERVTRERDEARQAKNEAVIELYRKLDAKDAVIRTLRSHFENIVERGAGVAISESIVALDLDTSEAELSDKTEELERVTRERDEALRLAREVTTKYETSVNLHGLTSRRIKCTEEELAARKAWCQEKQHCDGECMTGPVSEIDGARLWLARCPDYGRCPWTKSGGESK